jgi:ABC-type multidrug transport system fused ATPase/permease subunit
MTPQALYKIRIDNFRNEADLLQKKENRLSMARLITFVTGLALFFTLISIHITSAVVALLVSMIVFGWLIRQYAITEKLKDFYRHLETINRREEQCLRGNYSEYPDGSEHISHEHSNSYDLDLFGHASLFQYISRSTSKPAADMLASWLKSPAPVHEIQLRQQALTELRPYIEWRQKLITLGYTNNNAGKDPAELLDWVHGKNFFSRPRHLKAIVWILTGFGLLMIFLVILLGLPAAVLIPVFGINFLYYFSQGKRINRLHSQVGKYAEMLEAYADTIGLIESQSFGCTKLKQLQGVFDTDIPVSARIKLLSKQVSRLDTRLNVMVAIPLNLFFFWDIHCCLALENWKNRHAPEIVQWFSAMAEFEVLSSFANISFNHPEWTMPVVVPEYFVLIAKDAGHPLIPDSRRINNSIEINQGGKTVLVTGSNMSGKSTFLRTCGVNAVLALAGAPVCAAAFTISHVKVFSSMRISDSLEDNTSSFYAELKRLAAMIREAEQNQKVLLLLDEILRGTNSNDRFTGSVALIRQLIGYGTVSIVATHDLRLADLAKELPGKIDNYHFDVKIEGEELYFDYKLNPGICTSLNASILMKKMGIRI